MRLFFNLVMVALMTYLLSIVVRTSWKEWKLPYEGAMRFVLFLNLLLLYYVGNHYFRQNYGHVFNERGLTVGNMYSVVPFAPHEQRLSKSIGLWPHWSWDAFLFSAIFLIWVFYWANPRNPKDIPVHKYSLLLLSVGILTVAFHGINATKRALFIVAGLECTLWTADWSAAALRNQPPILQQWVIMLSTLSVVLLLRYSLAMGWKAEVRLLPQERHEA
jgi:hypothetical protein